ncbi:unnamed protein product [Calicophoron daubneyi]|uniref:Polypeptide N-acetylgalactosaminyltransferase n=1 Tax=Calicophoron daubneyi TaxID=300641 RepID=A0AAV2TNT6_CALDB
MRVHPVRFIRILIYCIPILVLLSTILYVFTPPQAVIHSKDVNWPSRWSSSEMISYEDPLLAAREAKREGPGEQGQPVRLSPEEQKVAENFKNQNGFNIYVSDKVAIDRSLTDIRHPNCKTKLYSSKLPQTSVIIPFFEEHWSTLLRTFNTTLLRSPPNLIKEVILVDDGSTMRDFLKDQLDNYLKEHYPDGKVRVVRSPTRQGLITARLLGAKAATGDVLVFLDSHCEPSHNWLPPLLHYIAADYKTVTCPFIDVIDGDNFHYRAQDEGARGAFDWELFYKRLPKLPEDEPHPDEPFVSPVMAGGLFAISAKWFWELGGYDPGLVIWGGEQYELSFKLWMCGGKMLDIPCSRIGHIYRVHPTNFPSTGISNFLGRNYKRVAEVWMDEYKEYVYNRRPSYRGIDPGNLTEQLAIRTRLNCSSFKWFMNNVAFDLTKRYPLVDPIPAAIGDIRSVVDKSLCIDAMGASQTVPVKLSKCIRDGSSQNGMQQFEFSYRDDIRPVKIADCLDVPGSQSRSPVILYPCHSQGGNQQWTLIPVDGLSKPVQIFHPKTKMCLTVDMGDQNEGTLYMLPCQPGLSSQHWVWEKLQLEEAKIVNKRFL